MAGTLYNKMMSRYLQWRYRRIESNRQDAIDLQRQTFNYLLSKGKQSEYGRAHSFAGIQSYSDFNHTPLNQYSALRPYIDQIINGQKNVLWPGSPNYLSKSAGTTCGKSKHIPVTTENLFRCHSAGCWDAISVLYYEKPDSKIFEERSLLLGGSIAPHPENPKIQVGDISAITIEHLPRVARPFFTPDFETALLHDWEEKIDRMTKVCSKEQVTMISGVPTWILVLFQSILMHTGKENMLEVWPKLKVYFHGGVSLQPYKDLFRELIPTDDIDYIQAYNASEGYFALQDVIGSDDMLLLCNLGVFYEFIPASKSHHNNPECLTLKDVELDTNYEMVISTNSGLWRYRIGDTVRFTSSQPYRIQITGRTQQFINVFGEEVMLHNVEAALSTTCQLTNSIVREYSIGPSHLDHEHARRHDWIIEFEKLGTSLNQFANLLDNTLQRVNGDYEAKRYKNMALKRLKIDTVPRGTFQTLMKRNGTFGGQHKVPRLSNSRSFIDQLLDVASHDKREQNISRRTVSYQS